MISRAVSAGVVLAVTVAACNPKSAAAGADGGTDCPVGFLGDGGAPDFDMQVFDSDGAVTALSDGDPVPLEFPPQGGEVLFVGVRATNVNGCGLQLTGAIRDLTTQEVRVDSRTVNLIDTGDGYGVSGTSSSDAGTSSIANFSNIAACPNEWSATNIYGTVYGVEVTIQDTGGRTLTKKIHATPMCGESGDTATCLCICKGGYILGESCTDAGAE